MARLKVVTAASVMGDTFYTLNYVSPGELEKKLEELKETISTLRSDVKTEIRELRMSPASAGGERETKEDPPTDTPENRDAILQKMREDMKADLIKMLEPLYMKIAALEDAETPAGSRKETAKISEPRAASGGDAALREVARWKVAQDTRLDAVETKIQFLAQEIELLKKKRR